MRRISTSISPDEILGTLSQSEINSLAEAGSKELYDTLRRCSLAVLNCGSEVDDSKQILEQYKDFDIHIHRRSRGIRLDLFNAPADAFVDGEIIRGIKEHLFAVIRDILYVNNELNMSPNNSQSITNAVFYILRNANTLRPAEDPNMVVCWGGHAIQRFEYDYTKEVGHELGLRKLNICTGCGPGAMKGPMKGANIAHAKQRHSNGRYIGFTEPGIIAAESPNPIVNHLVIFPDIEKRLEAFVRAGHAFIVFPGGVGTAEEILYLLGILLHPDNSDIPFPLIFTGPKESTDYFKQLDLFIGDILGEEAQKKYKIIINDPEEVARLSLQGVQAVRDYRRRNSDAFYYNWKLKIDSSFQLPFHPDHQSMAALQLHAQQPKHELAANLRKAFSGIVAGNIKVSGIRAIEEHGPFKLQGDKKILQALDNLLCAFVAQKRMKLTKDNYTPCYQLVDHSDT
ncbi:MAG TPA: nucleotide 5'-monophosphate nucleosidase PpnN [Pseudomonadales bacterium]|nr:nucleotide 5'-monophosphate nucleosidase PpnN [Pseudomonadales bacterium]